MSAGAKSDEENVRIEKNVRSSTTIQEYISRMLLKFKF
jgi:hypothetical protein